MEEYLLIDSWAQHITEVLQSESELIGGILEHQATIGDARETLVRAVLERIIPSSYEIGTGQIVDKFGKHSKQIDVVVARRDFPVLRMPNGSCLYPIESVVSAIEVKSTLNSTKLHEALDNVASISKLTVGIDCKEKEKLAAAFGLVPSDAGQDVFRSENGLDVQRLRQSVYPTTCIFGFRGYKKNVEDLKTAITTWASTYTAREKRELGFVALPAVISAEGCFSVKNYPPFKFTDNSLLGVGSDPHPLRLIIVQLLYQLMQRVPPLRDENDVAPDFSLYINRVGEVRKVDYLFSIDKAEEIQL